MSLSHRALALPVPFAASITRSCRWPTVIAVAFCVAGGLSGCDWIDRARLNGEQRINRAFPPPATLNVAVEGARAELEQEQVAKFDTEIGGLLRIRAVECAKGYSPSMLDSDADVRARVDKACLAKRDADLARWVGLWRVSAAARLPALIPAGPNHIPSLTAPAAIQRVWFADQAAVMLLQLGHGAAQVVDLATGRVLWTYEQRGNQQTGPLSPNGRLFAWSDGEKLTIRKTETGETLAEFPKGYAYKAQWLGSRGLLRDEEGVAGAKIVDLQRREEFAAPARAPRIVPVPDSTTDFMMLGYERGSRVRFADAPAAAGLQVLSDKPLLHPDIGRSGARTMDGRFYVESDRRSTLILTDLDTLAGQRLDVAPIVVEQVLPSPQADQLIVVGYVGNANRRTAYLLSIADRSVAVLDWGSPARGLAFAAPIGRLASYYDQELRFPELATTGAARRLDELVSEELAAANQKKLDALASALAGAGSPDDTNALSAKMQSGGTLAGITPDQGPLARLARDAIVEAVGVYQPNRSPRSGPPGVIEVRVRRTARPLVLVLSAYEAVRWNLILESGAQLAAVLTSGYRDQHVFGAGGARVVAIGHAHAYNRQSAIDLEREVYRATGKPISLFQGKYEGSSFVVGG